MPIPVINTPSLEYFTTLTGNKEYINDVIYTKPPIDSIHFIILSFLKREFLINYNCKSYSTELLIVDSSTYNTAVRPDLSVFDNSTLFKDNITTDVPKIIFEIVTDVNNKLEAIFKPKIYRKLGVFEYWLINIVGQTISIFDYYNDSYFSYKLCSPSVKSLVFDNIVLNFEQIYNELVKRKLIIQKDSKNQVGIYAKPGFDPWEWINRDEQ